MRPVEAGEGSTVGANGKEIARDSVRQSPGGKLPRFAELDGLRGFVALGVVFLHYMVGGNNVPALRELFHFSELTPISLDVFFILSGFLIGGILLHSRNNADYYKTFYRRRFYRILPLYYAWIGVFALLYCFTREGWGLAKPEWYSGAFYLASFAFLFQNFFPSIIESTFIVSPTWTLVVEEHFYLLIPLCVRRLSPRGLAKALLAVVAAAPIFRAVLFKYIGHRSDWADIATRIWPPCRADALALGVLLAMAWSLPEGRAWLNRHLGIFRWGMLGCSGAAMGFSWMVEANVNYSRVLNASLGRTAVELASLSLIVFLICRPQSVAGRFLASKTLRGFGRISYCLYLVHWGVYWMIFRFVLNTQFGRRFWLDLAVAPIAFLISWGIAELSWKYFESPLLRRAHGVREPAPSGGAMAEQQPQAA